MKNRVLLLFAAMMVLLFVMAGCGRKVVPSITTEVSDSVHVKEVTRFVPVPIPGDTVTVERLIECDSVTNKPKPFNIKKKSKHASVVLTVDSAGMLTSTGVCDSLNKVIKAKDTEIYRLKSTKTATTTPVYITSGFDKFCRWFFAITLILIVGTIGMKLKYF